MTGQRIGAWSAAALALLVVVLAMRPSPPPAPPDQAATPPQGSGWSLLALGGGADSPAHPAPAGTAAPAASRSPEHLHEDLFTDGSLRGAALDGGWGPWDGQRLSPSRELRRRFDQLLTTLGEAQAHELRALLGWLAGRDLGPQGADAVLSVWDRYVQLQQHRYRLEMDLQRPDRWPQVLQERQQVRRDVLGAPWAEAFYGAEERAFSERLQGTAPAPQAPTTADWLGPPPDGVSAAAWHRQRVNALGAEAADRLQAEERLQAEWTVRMDNARLAIDRIARAPELSAQQRQVATRQWLDQHFQGTEKLRASALLGL